MRQFQSIAGTPVFMHISRLPFNILIQKVYDSHKNFEFLFALQRCEYRRTGPRMSWFVARNLK